MVTLVRMARHCLSKRAGAAEFGCSAWHRTSMRAKEDMLRRTLEEDAPSRAITEPWFGRNPDAATISNDEERHEFV
jgi:hypothetical protein